MPDNTLAHIHLGPLSVAGPITPLFPTTPIDVTSRSFADLWAGLTPDDITALETDGTYANISMTAFPAGEIRGQIVSSAIPRARVAGAAGPGVGGCSRPGAAGRRPERLTRSVYPNRHGRCRAETLQIQGSVGPVSARPYLSLSRRLRDRDKGRDDLGQCAIRDGWRIRPRWGIEPVWSVAPRSAMLVSGPVAQSRDRDWLSAGAMVG